MSLHAEQMGSSDQPLEKETALSGFSLEEAGADKECSVSFGARGEKCLARRSWHV